MRLITLGTSCAQQTLTRTQSSHALAISPSVTYLFDCGSSTATSLLQAGIKFNSIRKIFITHLHTDHVIGLTGLMTDLLGGHGGRIEDFKAGVKREDVDREGESSKVIDVYGPCGVKEFLRTTFRLTYTILAKSFRLHELLFESDPTDPAAPFMREEGSRDVRIGADGAWKDISYDDKCKITAVPIHHTVPCIGYVVTEKDKVSIGPEIASALRSVRQEDVVRYTTLINQLYDGESIQLPDRTIGPLVSEKGRQIVILGDTSNSDAVLAHVQAPVDLVLHESTNAYLPDYRKPSDTLLSVRERAISRGHSTPEMAGEFARKCQSQLLILTHFSSRYSGADSHGAVKIMQYIERLASLAGSATQQSAGALSEKNRARDAKRPCTNGDKTNSLTYDGRVIAAWDGMHVDIPRTGVMLPARSPMKLESEPEMIG